MTDRSAWAFVVVPVAISVTAAAFSGDDDAAAPVPCSGEGYVTDGNAQSFCACPNVYLRCTSAGVRPTKTDCLCIDARAPCPSALDGQLFCSGNAGYQCKGGSLTPVLECPGSANCVEEATKDLLRCGTKSTYIDYALAGEACAGEQAAACTLDQSTVLDCQRGRWVEARTCSGGVSRCERVFQGDPGVNCAGGADACYGCGSL